MLFVFGEIPEYTPRSKRSNRPMITENEYFSNDVELLADFRCPTCKSSALFRGGVYIGCNACLNYFSEEEIILENIKG